MRSSSKSLPVFSGQRTPGGHVGGSAWCKEPVLRWLSPPARPQRGCRAPRGQRSRHQRARRVVEQLVDREAARQKLLAGAEVDDDLEDRPAGLDAEAVGIERLAMCQSGGALALMQLVKDLAHHVGAL